MSHDHFVELDQLPVALGCDGGTTTKPYGDNVPICTAAMYRTVRRDYAKLYGGNWRRGRIGTLIKYPGKSRMPKTDYPGSHTTNNVTIVFSIRQNLACIRSNKRRNM